ncbi:MAG: hypothetical protein LBS50_08080 [Prevotellaceae bacterium]|jgi:hypothetical protein|nr:hypothetical protein [Prevotellaceae bacterium]
MKKTVFIIGILALSFTVQAQVVNNAALWANLGYSSFLNGDKASKPLGNVGEGIGGGYELYANGFLLQIGGEFQHLSSTMKIDDLYRVYSMISTDNKLYDGSFYFQKNRDFQNLGSLGGVFMLGYQSEKSFYFLVGGKVFYNLFSNARTRTTVTTKAYFDNLIGENDNGIFSNFPNHGLTTTGRKIQERLEPNPVRYAGSIELGMRINSWSALGASYRLGFFCDFGLASLKRINYSENIINISKTEEFQPALTSFLTHNTTDNNSFYTLFTGIKLTVLWGSEKGKCKCLQNMKWKHLHKK